MTCQKGLVCLGVISQVALLAGAVSAQDMPQPVAINTLGRVAGGPAPGSQSPSLQGTDNAGGTDASPDSTDPSRAGGGRRGRRGRRSTATTADMTTDTTTTRRLPRAGGDPATLAGLGFVVFSAGGFLRFRRKSA